MENLGSTGWTRKNYRVRRALTDNKKTQRGATLAESATESDRLWEENFKYEGKLFTKTAWKEETKNPQCLHINIGKKAKITYGMIQYLCRDEVACLRTKEGCNERF